MYPDAYSFKPLRSGQTGLRKRPLGSPNTPSFASLSSKKTRRSKTVHQLFQDFTNRRTQASIIPPASAVPKVEGSLAASWRGSGHWSHHPFVTRPRQNYRHPLTRQVSVDHAVDAETVALASFGSNWATGWPPRLSSTMAKNMLPDSSVLSSVHNKDTAARDIAMKVSHDDKMTNAGTVPESEGRGI
jgi:hypothetical protein